MSTPSALKRIFYPGFNLGTRSRKAVGKLFLREADARTLDCGCGNGYFTAMAVRAGGSALGVSFDAEQIARCNEFEPFMKVPADKLEFRVSNAADMDAITERFDQILLLEVIEHIDNDAEVIAKLAKLLKPGGIMHITTPVSRFGQWVGFLDRHNTGGHVRLGYTDDRLEAIVRAAGLDIAYQSRLGGLGVFLTPMQLKLCAWLGGTARSEGLAFLLIYPLFLLLQLVPVTYSLRAFHHIVARKPT
jgi:SAM-dependent methyltransferase